MTIFGRKKGDMLKSMTGFGKAESAHGAHKVRVEVKSLNSKQADVSVKLPLAYREREMELRNEVTQALVRGKIDVYVSLDSDAPVTDAVLQPQVAEAYYRQIETLAARLGLPVPEDILNSLLRFPDVFSSAPDESALCPWEEVLGCVRSALSQTDDFRRREGQALTSDLMTRVRSIMSFLERVEIMDTRRMDAVRSRIRVHLEESGASGAIDQNRFEQELIYYLEKMDITEEKVRLGNHCAFFLETLDGEELAGRKLGFIAQEMGREINTMGSKASDSEVQQVVVAMKDELEKIKEQLLNIL